jgi:hypothetical protein
VKALHLSHLSFIDAKQNQDGPRGAAFDVVVPLGCAILADGLETLLSESSSAFEICIIFPQKPSSSAKVDNGTKKSQLASSYFKLLEQARLKEAFSIICACTFTCFHFLNCAIVIARVPKKATTEDFNRSEYLAASVHIAGSCFRGSSEQEYRLRNRSLLQGDVNINRKESNVPRHPMGMSWNQVGFATTICRECCKSSGP